MLIDDFKRFYLFNVLQIIVQNNGKLVISYRYIHTLKKICCSVSVLEGCFVTLLQSRLLFKSFASQWGKFSALYLMLNQLLLDSSVELWAPK